MKMCFVKTKKALLAFMVVLSLLTCAFGEEAEEELLLARLPGEYTEGYIELSAPDALDLLGLEEDDYSEILYFESEDGYSAQCIFALRGVNEAACENALLALEAYREAFMQQVRTYSPENYQLLSQAVVSRRGDIVVMVAGEHARVLAGLLLGGE